MSHITRHTLQMVAPVTATAAGLIVAVVSAAAIPAAAVAAAAAVEMVVAEEAAMAAVAAPSHAQPQVLVAFRSSVTQLLFVRAH